MMIPQICLIPSRDMVLVRQGFTWSWILTSKLDLWGEILVNTAHVSVILYIFLYVGFVWIVPLAKTLSSPNTWSYVSFYYRSCGWSFILCVKNSIETMVISSCPLKNQVILLFIPKKVIRDRHHCCTQFIQRDYLK